MFGLVLIEMYTCLLLYWHVDSSYAWS